MMENVDKSCRWDGGRIREARKAAHLTQAQLAERIGCHSQHISRWESGEREPGATKLRLIADAIGCKIDDLV